MLWTNLLYGFCGGARTVENNTISSSLKDGPSSDKNKSFEKNDLYAKAIIRQYITGLLRNKLINVGSALEAWTTLYMIITLIKLIQQKST